MNMCVCVDACTYAYGGSQKKMLGLVLYQLLSPYLLEKGSRARLKARSPQQSSCLSAPSLPQHAGIIGIAMPGFLCRWWKIEPRSSCTASAEASPQIFLLRALNMVSNLLLQWRYHWLFVQCECTPRVQLFQQSVEFGNFWDFWDVGPCWRK